MNFAGILPGAGACWRIVFFLRRLSRRSIVPAKKHGGHFFLQNYWLPQFRYSWITSAFLSSRISLPSPLSGASARCSNSADGFENAGFPNGRNYFCIILVCLKSLIYPNIFMENKIFLKNFFFDNTFCYKKMITLLFYINTPYIYDNR